MSLCANFGSFGRLLLRFVQPEEEPLPPPRLDESAATAGQPPEKHAAAAAAMATAPQQAADARDFTPTAAAPTAAAPTATAPTAAAPTAASSAEHVDAAEAAWQANAEALAAGSRGLTAAYEVDEEDDDVAAFVNVRLRDNAEPWPPDGPPPPRSPEEALDAAGRWGMVACGAEVRLCADDASKGLGGFATRRIAEGTVVGVYWGELLTQREYALRHGWRTGWAITDATRAEKAAQAEREARLAALKAGAPIHGARNGSSCARGSRGARGCLARTYARARTHAHVARARRTRASHAHVAHTSVPCRARAMPGRGAAWRRSRGCVHRWRYSRSVAMWHGGTAAA